MDDYISRDVAIIEFMDNDLDHIQAPNGKEAVQILSDIPAADVVPVVHGRWISDVFCSECGWVNEVESGFIGDTKGFNFCPNCGAKMYKE